MPSHVKLLGCMLKVSTYLGIRHGLYGLMSTQEEIERGQQDQLPQGALGSWLWDLGYGYDAVDSVHNADGCHEVVT